MLLELQQSGHIVRSLEAPAETEEVPGFVVGDRGVDQPLKELEALPNASVETRGILLRLLWQRRTGQREAESIDLLPHLRRDALPHPLRRGPRAARAGEEGAFVVGIEGQVEADLARAGIRL